MTLIAPAGRALAETKLNIEAGVNGEYEPGDQLIVRVSVTSDELIDGEIVLTMRTSEITVQRDVQIAAGTTKVFYFTLPTTWDNPAIDVSLRDSGDEVAKRSATPRQSSSELVGVLPRLASRAGDLPLDVSLGQILGDAIVSALPTEIVDLGPTALRAYDSIAAGGDDLAQLDDAQRDTLLTWVSLGGILLLDDDSAVSDLPDEWRPGANGYALADLGEVRLVDGDASGGRWDQIIPLTTQGMAGPFGGTEFMTDPQMDLAQRAGLDLPSIAPLAIGIGVYAVVLGPIVYLVLRKMRRLTLGWFVIPTLAVLTAGGVALAGGGALRNGNPADATFIQESPAGAYAISNVLTFSSQGGTTDITIPAGWTLAQQGNMFWGDGRQTPITITRHTDGTSSAAVALEATQANVRAYAGNTRSSGLVVSAEWDGEREVNGTVTNNSDVAFHDVAVFAGEDEALVGDLEPGASAEFSMNAIRRIRFAFENRAASVWGDPFNGNGMVFDDKGRPLPDDDEDDASAVEFGVWGMASGDVELFPFGMVRAVGWTNEIPSELIEGEDTSTATAISSLAPITSDGRGVGVVTVRAQAVRGPFGFNGDANNQVFRYVLPADAEPDELFLVDHVHLNIHELAFWDGADWIEADALDPAVPVPENALRNGVVLIRTDVDMNIPQQGIPTLTDTEPEEGS